MKSLLVLFMLTAFTAGICAQELDSLKAIMDKKNAPEKVEGQDASSFAPVIVNENEDEVNIRILDKEVVKVIDSGD